MIFIFLQPRSNDRKRKLIYTVAGDCSLSLSVKMLRIFNHTAHSQNYWSLKHRVTLDLTTLLTSQCIYKYIFDDIQLLHNIL